jgi:hypothetical protein
MILLTKKFKHKHWFLNSDITVKEFLNYVLASGDFIIKEKSICKSDNLLEDPEKVYYLSDRKYSYKLSQEEFEYLADNNEYFKSKLA